MARRHTIPTTIATLLLMATTGLVFPDMSLAQPCADWTESMPRPEYYPDRPAHDLVFHDGLVLMVEDSLYVCNPAMPGLRVIGRCDAPDYIDSRIRELDEGLFLVSGPDGVFAIDLSDPTVPSIESVLNTGAIIRDLAEFDQGVIAVTEPGGILILDSMAEGKRRVVATRDEPDDLRVVVASGSRAWIGGNLGVAGVDLSDPEDPVVSERTCCAHEDEFGIQQRFYELILDGNKLYTAAIYSWIMGGAQGFIQIFDVDSSLEPQPVECLDTGLVRDISLLEDKLIAVCSHELRAYSVPELEHMGTMALPHAFSQAPGGVQISPDAGLAYVHDSGGLARYDLNALGLVEPMFNIPGSYDPEGCGRFGVLRTYVDEPHPQHLYTLCDQTNPADLLPITQWEIPTPEGHPYGPVVVAQTEDWAIVEFQYEVDEGPQHRDTYAYDLDGNEYQLYSGCFYDLVVDGDILWFNTLEYPSYDRILSAFDISGSEPLLVASLPVDHYGNLRMCKGALLIQERTRWSLYDVANPAAPELMETVDDPDLPSYCNIMTADGFAYAGGRDQYADRFYLKTIAVDPATCPSVVITSDLEVGFWTSSMAIRDDVLALGGREPFTAGCAQWQLWSIADPERPHALSPVIAEPLTADVSGFVLSGDCLYINFGSLIFLYDIANPSAPQWLGQATGGYRACRIGWHLMAGSSVLPLHCADPQSIAEPETRPEDQIPETVVLHCVSPNPFNPTTSISFDLERPERVSLTVYDLHGRLVAHLADADYPAGRHEMSWHGVDDRGRALPSGPYFVRLETDSGVRTAKAALIR